MAQDERLASTVYFIVKLYITIGKKWHADGVQVRLLLDGSVIFPQSTFL